MKTRVNLYLEHLRPVKEILPLQQCFFYTVIALVLMVLCFVFLSYQTASLEENNRMLKTEQQIQEVQLAERAATLASLTTNTPLLKEIDTIRTQINQKQRILKALDNAFEGNSGFSHIFSSLTTINMNSVWLTHISTNNGQLNFAGSALDPKDIPRWVNALESSQALDGKKFSNLSLVREGNVVHFTLHNTEGFINGGGQ